MLVCSDFCRSSPQTHLCSVWLIARSERASSVTWSILKHNIYNISVILHSLSPSAIRCQRMVEQPGSRFLQVTCFVPPDNEPTFRLHFNSFQMLHTVANTIFTYHNISKSFILVSPTVEHCSIIGSPRGKLKSPVRSYDTTSLA